MSIRNLQDLMQVHGSLCTTHRARSGRSLDTEPSCTLPVQPGQYSSCSCGWRASLRGSLLHHSRAHFSGPFWDAVVTMILHKLSIAEGPGLWSHSNRLLMFLMNYISNILSHCKGHAQPCPLINRLKPGWLNQCTRIKSPLLLLAYCSANFGALF